MKMGIFKLILLMALASDAYADGENCVNQKHWMRFEVPGYGISMDPQTAVAHAKANGFSKLDDQITASLESMETQVACPAQCLSGDLRARPESQVVTPLAPGEGFFTKMQRPGSFALVLKELGISEEDEPLSPKMGASILSVSQTWTFERACSSLLE